MPIDSDDIQLSNDAIGIGKALRIVGTGSTDVVITEDADFPNIKIVTVNSTGGSGGLTQQQIEGLI